MRLGFFNRNYKHSCYLWYTKSTTTTGKNLANELGINCGCKVPPKNSDVVIGWGSRLKNSDINLSYLNDKIVLNKHLAIKNNRDKVLSLKIMQERAVNVPKFCIDSEVDRKITNKDITFPLIARTRFHQGGSGFELCLCKRDIRRARNRGINDYYIQYIPNHKEYRVHVFDKNIIRVQIKKGLKDCDNWKRNHDSGWVFSNIEIENTPKQILTEALNAVKSLGLTFGAADLIFSDYEEAFVIEVNSAPGLEDNGLEIYSSAINNYLTGRGIKNIG